MNSLDTNLILRFLLRDVAHQVSQAIRVITTSECYVTDSVFTETIFVLEKVYEIPRTRIATLTKGFLSFVNLAHSSYLADVIDLFEKQQSLSIIDCYAAVEARNFGNQLVTFDKRLLKYGGDHVVTP